MKVLINNYEIDIKIEENDENIDIIEEIKKQIEEDKKIVQSILIDGKDVQEVSEADIEKAKIVEFETSTPRILLLEALQEMNLYLDRLVSGINEICELLNNDEERQATEMVVTAIEGFEWIYSVLLKVETVTSIKFEECEFGVCFETFKELMSQMLESIENRDFIMLNDLLEYEMLDLLQEIKDKLPELYNDILEEEQNSRN